MATFAASQLDGAPRPGASPRLRNRGNLKETPCKNVSLYGQCRDAACQYYHPPLKPIVSQPQIERKRFNIDSPSFTPSIPAANGLSPVLKSSTLTSKAASAAPFKPKSLTPASSVASFTSSSNSKAYNPNAPDFLSPDVPDFMPQTYSSLSTEQSTDYNHGEIYHSLHDSNGSDNTRVIEPQQQSYQYATGINGTVQQSTYIPTANTTSHVLQHHLYAPLNNHLDTLKPYQRSAKDVFIPEDLRLKLHKKTEALLRSFSNSQLPNIEHFHTLTPLEAISQRNSLQPGLTTSVYKAVSDHDGKTYCLRRIHDFRVLRDSESAQAVISLKSKWQRISNSTIVKSHIAFSTQLFGDNSIVIVSDFFPDSITLRDRHLGSNGRATGRNHTLHAPEHLLWSYMVQVANALKAIHGSGMAARNLDAKRWLVTDEDHIRFNACGISDITEPGGGPIQDLQRADLHQLGKLIFSLGTANAHNKMRPTDHFAKAYSSRFRQTVEWLQHQTISAESSGTIEDFCRIIATDTIDAFDASLRLDDVLQHTLNKELESSRLVRLLLKLNSISDRPEYESNTQWRDQGQRSALKLFRDHVFHQTDANGQPTIDMGHMLACLNKLDVGIEEKVMLTTRDGLTVMVVTYREMKAAVESSWSELMRRSNN